MKRPKNLPTIEEKTQAELDDILAQIQASSLSAPVKDFIVKCIESALWFPHILQKKNISLTRLKTMLFGKGYRSNKKPSKSTTNDSSSSDKSTSNAPTDTNAALGADANTSANNDELTSSQGIEAKVNKPSEDTTSDDASNKTVKGHGRMPHTVYPDYTEVTLTINGLGVGSPCPEALCQGKLYEFEPKKPRVLVRIKGQNFADVYKYVVERLRCNLCGILIQADIPAEIGTEKYDASFKALLALQKYYVAVPFYRQETFQRTLNFPLPDATQWDLVEQLAGFCYQPFMTLITYAANGELVHNDDTKVRILEVIEEMKANPDKKRKGMFTTGIVANYEGHEIALFLNGIQHAGENLEQVLQQRDNDKPPIIQMCDALNVNMPKTIQTIVANCLSHGFRKFEELVEYFPTPCITVMKLLSQVYANDECTKGMSKEVRLEYHQQHSNPVMDLLTRYIEALFTEKQVEPNSELGKALHYMQKHWPELTCFLRVAGAPLCNNIVERALKVAIRNRKAAMFYRTRYSAQIGGMLTSLIYTCQLAATNPHHYLTVLQTHAEQVRVNPAQWLPWNYQQTMAEADAAKPPVRPPTAACLAVA